MILKTYNLTQDSQCLSHVADGLSWKDIVRQLFPCIASKQKTIKLTVYSNSVKGSKRLQLIEARIKYPGYSASLEYGIREFPVSRFTLSLPLIEGIEDLFVSNRRLGSYTQITATINIWVTAE